MDPFELVKVIPLLTALSYLGCVALQLVRRRVRTWTERLFVMGLFCISLYALDDWFFFNMPVGSNPSQVGTALASLAFSYLTFAALCFLLFMKAFHSHLRQRDVLLLPPTAVMLFLSWNGLVTGVEPAPWGWKGSFSEAVFVVFVIYALLYMIMGVTYTYRISKALAMENPRLGTKTLRLTLVFIAMVVMGALTNVLFQFLRWEVPPLFSSLLLVPGLALLLLLSPLTKDRIASFMKRWKSQAYEVRHAFLVYENGTLIASASESENEAKVDNDIFAATLDAIQSYMRTSFPLLRGKWLRTIEHGAKKIILERGRRVYLAVVISGEENDQLKRMMKDIVTAIEAQNPATLMNWTGVPEHVVGVRPALGILFRHEEPSKDGGHRA